MEQEHYKAFDVIVVGELNIDLIMNQMDAFPETGKEILARQMTFTLGSSAAIFASNISTLEIKVAFIGKIGNDLFGSFCRDQLHSKGVDTSMIFLDNALSTGATVILNNGEDRANVTYAGAMDFLTPDEITEEMLSKGKHLHFSSYFMQEGFKDKLDILFEKAKKAGLTTSLDIQWDPAERWDFDYRRILPLVDVFLPNEKELLCITKQSTIERAINELSAFANTIVVKRGAHGSLMHYQNSLLPCGPFINKNVVDAIGAGDSFNAGFISRFVQQYPLADCQKFGNLTGAISTTKAGGTNAFVNYQETMRIAKEKFGYEE